MTLPLVDMDWPQLPAGVAALSTTRRGGISAAPYDNVAGGGGLNLGTHVGDAAQSVETNRACLRAMLPAEPVWLRQVHGVRVIDAARVGAASEPPEADASISTTPGVVCAIMTADCLPVLLADEHGRVVGAAHAGWRGLAAGVLQATVEAMREAGAGRVLAWLGPAIGPRQFEVGEDVVQAFASVDNEAAAFRPLPQRTGKYLADLPALARLSLVAAGVTDVTGGDHCTVSEPSDFYSFRRDGVTGRMASLIWIK